MTSNSSTITSHPLLTLRDPNARIRGSRDPLGTQVLWSRLGREVVRNLTTVTTSMRGFTTLILGLYFVGKLLEDGKAEVEELAPLFLKFEQLAAYSRIALRKTEGHGSDQDILGVQRATTNLRENAGRVTISANPRHQIMSDQRSYGLWGLYSVAARASGLLEAEGQQLTGPAREFIESAYLDRFPRGGAEVIPFLRGDRDFAPEGKDSELARIITSILGNKITADERQFYHKHLVTACNAPLQVQLWEQIRHRKSWRSSDAQESFGAVDLHEIQKRCAAAGEAELAECLESISVTECVIAPLGRLFAFLLQRDGAKLSSVVEDITTAWGRKVPSANPEAFDAVLAARLAKADAMLPGSGYMSQAAHALSCGGFEECILSLLLLNSEVMKQRGGAPWIVLKSENLDVRYREQESELPDRKELPDLWVSTYYINALQAVGMQVHGDG